MTDHKSINYAVIGLGKFGFHVAKGLAQQGLSVMAIDKDEERFKLVNEFVQDAIIMDSTDIQALKEAGMSNIDISLFFLFLRYLCLKEAGMSNIDAAIVSIGENIEASILTVMALKEIGVETVIAKAITRIHGQILSKIGASKVIYPEMDTAKKLVRKIVKNLHYETLDISITIKLAKFPIPKFWIGTSILSPTFETQYHIKPIAYKHQGVWHTKFENDDILEDGDSIVVLGENTDIETLSKKVSPLM